MIASDVLSNTIESEEHTVVVCTGDAETIEDIVIKQPEEECVVDEIL